MENVFLGDIFIQFIRDAIFEAIYVKYSDIASAMHSLMTAILVLTLVVIGVRATLNDIYLKGHQFAYMCFFCSISLYVTEPDNYYYWIIDSVVSISDGMVSLFSGKGGTLFSSINKEFDYVFQHANNLLKISGLTNILPAVTAIGLMLVFGLYYALIVAVIGVSWLCLGIFLILGGVVIPLVPFQLFRGLGKSWITAVVKFSFVPMFATVIVTLVNHISGMFVERMMQESYNEGYYIDGAAVNTMSLAGVLLCGILGGYLMLKVIELTSELTGGIASDTKGAMTAISSTINTAVNTGKLGTSALSKLKSTVK